ncbi:PAS domain-containing protein [Hansschlegelia beijingensis]
MACLHARRGRASQRKGSYAAYVDNTPDGVFVVSIAPDGTIAAETMNRVLERALEIGEGGVQGRRLAEFMPAPMAARLTRKIDECVASGAPLRYEETAEILGLERVFEVMLAPVEALAGATHRVVGSARDLTERREAERQLRQAQKMEAIGQLTGEEAFLTASSISLARCALGAFERMICAKARSGTWGSGIWGSGPMSAGAGVSSAAPGPESSRASREIAPKTAEADSMWPPYRNR